MFEFEKIVWKANWNDSVALIAIDGQTKSIFSDWHDSVKNETQEKHVLTKSIADYNTLFDMLKIE